MGHPDNGTLLAFLDGEVDRIEAEELRAHLDACPECQGALQALEGASETTARALASIDTAPPASNFSAILGDRPKKAPPGKGAPLAFPFSMTLPRAASIALLLTAGLASALPGSPVRRWLDEAWSSFRQGSEIDLPAQPQAAPVDLLAVDQGPETGAGIPTEASGIEIFIHELPQDADLSVKWIDGEEAWVYAGEGTRFNGTAGRLEAFSPPGAVRVEIPRSLDRVVVTLNGEVLLRKAGAELEILRPVEERTPSEIHFEAPGHRNDPPV